MTGPARIQIRFGGTGGQGLILAGTILADALAAQGRHIAQSQTYEPTSRGGYCNSNLVVADAEVDYPLTAALDQLVLLDRLAVQPSSPLLKAGALVIADARLCPELPAGNCRIHHLPLSRTAIELGSERANTPRSYLDLNLDALASGYALAAATTGSAPPPSAQPLGVTARA